MSSLFQGLVDATGRVRTTSLDPGVGSVVFRGIALDDTGAVHVSFGAVIAGYVGGVPVSNTGVVCITDTNALPEDTLPGALRTVGGRMYTTPIDAPQFIHQGVGLRTAGRLCRVNV